jgi:amidophosphoribosyltransferase
LLNSIHISVDIAGDSNEGEMEEGWVISSESCGFLSIGARYEREVHPGEIVEMTKDGIKTIGIVERPNAKPQAFCIFEYVYFARSDSIFEG